MQIKTKISIITAIFICLFFVVSCGDSSKKDEEPKNDTDIETNDGTETADDSEVSDETETPDTDETTDDSDAGAESGKARVSSIKFTVPEDAATIADDSDPQVNSRKKNFSQKSR